MDSSSVFQATQKGVSAGSPLIPRVTPLDSLSAANTAVCVNSDPPSVSTIQGPLAQPLTPTSAASSITQSVAPVTPLSVAPAIEINSGHGSIVTAPTAVAARPAMIQERLPTTGQVPRSLVTVGPPGHPVTAAIVSSSPTVHPTTQNIVVTAINPGVNSTSAFSTAQSLSHSVVNNSQPLSNLTQQQCQRLKVEDALSYLDKVKYSFNNQPQVYNDFLDIMKEFKSQSIDTPGVIQRVSDLFRGHPDLIFGFNTFLPPGYRIEIHSNEQVSVSMPSNTVIIQSSGGITTTLSHPPLNNNESFSLSNSQGINASHMNSKPIIMNQKQTPQPLPAHIEIPSQSNPLAAAANGAGTQPVEFNHAINYVNKIKNRYSTRPEVYKQFLEILHAYQKEQKNVKEGRTPDKNSMTDTQVYAKVATLFQDQSDLLNEFALFLPESNSVGSNTFSLGGHSQSVFATDSHHSSAISRAQHQDNLAAANRAANNDHGAIVKKPISRNMSSHLNQNYQSKRYSNQQAYSSPSKRLKMTSIRDVPMSEAAKYGSLNDFAFFDKVRKAVRSQDVYDSFLRCLLLYNHEIISRTEIVGLVAPYIGKFPELFRWFKEFVGYREGPNNISNSMNNFVLEGLPQRVVGIRDRERDRMGGDVGMEIDYATCKRYGASYRALPKNYPQPKCSGRTALCKEVLNDTWVSFPSWSEDSTFVTSKKTQYEEYISKCEDERFELDVVIETNLVTIRVLEAVQKKMHRMTPDEKSRFKLDDCLGGTSATIHQRAIRRIYGDKAPELIDGLKKNPAVAVGIVLRRLKMKEEEWREAQKSFNKIWREQNERYYLKSLDHQGISFKANDIKFLRSKNLLNEIETIFEERHDANEDQSNATITGGDQSNHNASGGPHITLHYKDKAMIDEACNLIIHHIKRQTSIHKEDKQKIKQLMRHFIPDLFATPRGELSDDELDEHDLLEPKIKEVKSRVNEISPIVESKSLPSRPFPPSETTSPLTSSPDWYSLMFGNNNWYLFFRLHCILCERLTKMYERAQIIALEEEKERTNRKESTAIALRLKPRNEIDSDEYFPVFVDMIKQVLDGNMDGNQFEDTLREMFGIHAFIGFTMDKVVQNICRQLQHIVVDESCSQCTELYLEEQKASTGLSTGGPSETQSLRATHETVYQKKAEQILQDENCFKIMVFKNEAKVTIELLDTETAESEDGMEIERWSEYVEKYAKEDETITDELKERLSRKPVFLPRSIPSWRLKGIDEKGSDDDQNLSQTSDKEANGSNDRSQSDQQNTDVSDIEMKDESQCRFNVNNYKMVFVVDSECYMYKRQAIRRARLSHQRVSRRLHHRFNDWHMKWLQEKALPEEIKSCDEWLMGLCYERDRDLSEKGESEMREEGGGDGLGIENKKQSYRTRRVRMDDADRTPYRPFCKYKVEARAT